jgi:KDO2-lipid IV(A) lauroyltransferase
MPLVLVARAVAFLPWSWLRAAGALLGAFAGSFLRIRRAHVERAIRGAGIDDARAVVRGMYASLGTALFEFLWMVGRPRAPLTVVRFTARAQETLDARLASGRGIVVATAHTGNWDLVACASASRVPLAVVTKKLKVGWLDRFWQSERASRGVVLLHGEGAFRGAVRALSGGRSVAMIVDQAPEQGSAFVKAPFMGEPANCDLVPAMLAVRARVPLVLALGSRNADGTHEVDIPLVVDPPERPSRAFVEETTHRINEALETFVRRHPSQWLWLHRRWKEVPPPPASATASAFSLPDRSSKYRRSHLESDRTGATFLGKADWHSPRGRSARGATLPASPGRYLAKTAAIADRDLLLPRPTK